MRYVIALVVALGIAAAIYWFTRSKPEPPKPAVGTASATATTTAAPTPVSKTEHVRQLDPTARKQLREQLAVARTKGRAISTAPETQSTKAGSVPAEDPVISLEEAGPTVDALKETPALLAKCYGDQGENFRALARMTIISDPDLGAVIDTDAIVDKDGKPVDAKIEECMRDTIDSLALPPMSKPGKLKVEYTFRN